MSRCSRPKTIGKPSPLLKLLFKLQQPTFPQLNIKAGKFHPSQRIPFII